MMMLLPQSGIILASMCTSPAPDLNWGVQVFAKQYLSKALMRNSENRDRMTGHGHISVPDAEEESNTVFLKHGIFPWTVTGRIYSKRDLFSPLQGLLATRRNLFQKQPCVKSYHTGSMLKQTVC
jgi:hypothetical protein